MHDSHAKRLACLCAWSLVLHTSMASAAEAGSQPRAVAVMALPYQPDPAINRLFSALWNLPAGLVDGPVADLRKKGGSFQIQSDGRGLVVVAEGPPAFSEAVILAAKNFATGDFSPQMVPWAKAAVLKADALSPMGPTELGEERLWELFYGQSTSSNALKVEDLALLRLGEAELKAFQQRLQQQKAIFYSDNNTRQPSSFVPAQPTQQPGPALLRVSSLHLDEARLLVGQPLPPFVALRQAAGAEWVRTLQSELADLNAKVRLSFRPSSVLLILDLPLRGKSADEMRQVVAARLGRLGNALSLTDPIASAPQGLSAAPLDTEANGLRRQAEDQLLFGRSPVAMTERLWAEAWGLVLVPEAMRCVWLVPEDAP